MNVRVYLPAPLQQYAEGQTEVPLAAGTVGDALRALAARFPGMEPHLLGDGGQPRSFLAVFLNDDDVRHRGGFSAALAEGDVLTLVPSVAGGTAGSYEIRENRSEPAGARFIAPATSAATERVRTRASRQGERGRDESRPRRGTGSAHADFGSPVGEASNRGEVTRSRRGYSPQHTDGARRGPRSAGPRVAPGHPLAPHAMKTRQPPAPATIFSFVGNVGCIRFPPAIRKASGIKRGDRLVLTVEADGTLVLEKLQVSEETLREALAVEGCACQNAPEGCAAGGPEVLSVGWSYVRLPEARATELGLAADAPLRLVGEPGRITVSLHPPARDMEGVSRVACPP